MQLKIGMPEFLILFSLLIYSNSFTFSLVAFCLGIAGRLFDYVTQHSLELKKAEAVNQNIEEMGQALSGLFGGKKN
jgi:hypothetical protein